jgi:arylsulfatase A-like enzyme
LRQAENDPKHTFVMHPGEPAGRWEASVVLLDNHFAKMLSMATVLFGRRTFIGGILLTVFVIATWLLWPQPPGSRDVPVIIYLVDTLRADRLGVYGYSEPTSPGLDALAAQSVVFDGAYAPAPWTLPSVVSLVTSTFACEHGVVSNRTRLGTGLPTLAGQLSSVGYMTAGIYANPYAGPKFGLDRGYQELSKMPRQNVDRGAIERLLNRAGNTPTNPTGAGPFFFYFHTTETHNPFNAPFRITNRFGQVKDAQRRKMEEFVTGLRGLSIIDWSTGKLVGTTDNSVLQNRTMDDLVSMEDTVNVLYDSAVWWADANLKSVIDVLKRRGVWDKAIFIFLSDHGEELGEHGGWLHDQSVYEELARVPLLIHFPDDEFAGRRIDQPVSLVDIMPTIFDYLGKPELCGSCQGTSLLPLIRGMSPKSESAKPIVAMRVNVMKHYRPWKKSRGDLNIVARREHWKGIWNDEVKSLELYDLNQDPGEQVDVSTKQAELAKSLSEQAGGWLSDCQSRAKEVEGSVEMDQETIDEFRALGYFN